VTIQSTTGWSTIRGHRVQLEFFRNVLASQRLGQAYLLVGPGGIGKRTFARQLAACLLCPGTDDDVLESCGECSSCKQIAADSHPDLLEVGLPEGKNLIPIRLLAGDRESRGRAGLCYDLSLSPMESQRRVAILDAADHIEQIACSSLLKTLEEPPPRAIIILVADSEAGILDTIRSRCQLVRFSPLEDDDMIELLLASETVPNRQEAERVARLAEGSLSTAALMQDPKLQALRDAVYKNLATMPVDPLAMIDEVVPAWEDLGGDGNTKRVNATWIARFAIEFYRAVLRFLAGADTTSTIPDAQRLCQSMTVGDTAAIDRIAALLDRCLEAEREPMSNVMLPLALEAFFADLAKQSRIGTD
jgi:DNA polymerase-3 subunit delta'